MPYNLSVFTFVETKLFTRLVQQYLSDEEYARIQNKLIADAEAGVVVRGSGGVRKLRVGTSNRGKRGAYRLIYYTRLADDQIWMLTIYPKNVTNSIPAHVLKAIRQEIEDE